MTEAGARPAAAADGFRSDINGLRAISIALVVAFHLTRRWIPGGFVGVDVFFVISGFLMTGIILGRLRDGRFRLADFYGARLRRIWPALVALCAVLLAVGVVTLDPWTFEKLAGDIPTTLAFLSNIVFAGRRGYFEPDEGANWLLHTWSLSVEWQFYLLYPLLMMAIFAVPTLRRRMWIWLGVLAAGSFVLSLALSAKGNGWSFYMLPTRAWELLAGAFCAAPIPIALGRWRRLALHTAGLAMIATGAASAIPADNWPSAWALLPVGGAALVIAANVRRAVWADNRAVGLVGRASYSIYIWHWPLLVALRYAGVVRTAPVLLGTVVAMVALGLASYWLIEQRATRWFFSRNEARAGGVVLVVALIAVAVVAQQTHGFEAARVADPAERAALADDRAAASDWAFPTACGRIEKRGRLTFCRMGDPAARQVLVIGDSHAEQIAPRYAHRFDGRPGQGVTFLTQGGCLPVPGVAVVRGGGGCARWANAARYAAATGGFKRVVLIAAWPAYFEKPDAKERAGAKAAIICLADARGCRPGSPATLQGRAGAVFGQLRGEIIQLQRAGVEVVLVGPTPTDLRADPQQLYLRAFWRHDLTAPPLSRAAFEAEAGLVRAHLAAVRAQTGAPLVDPLDTICPAGACPVFAGGQLLYKDSGHFRAAAVMGPTFGYLDPWVSPGSIRLKASAKRGMSGAFTLTPGSASP